MSAPNLIIAVDLANHLVVSYRGSSTDLNFRQTRYTARIYIVNPTAVSQFSLATYSPIDYTQYDGLRVGLWSGSTGTLGDAPSLNIVLADEMVWALTTDGTAQCYEGVFDCNNAGVAAFLGSSSSASAYFAINLVKGTDLVSAFDHTGGVNCTINSATDTYS